MTSTSRMHRIWYALASLAGLLLMVAGCDYTIMGNPDVNLTVVGLTPQAASIAPGSTILLTASARYARNDSSVSWSIVGNQVGTLNSSGDSATYQAPFIINAPTTVRIRVTSNEDPTVSSECLITIVEPQIDNNAPVSVLVNPMSVTIGTGVSYQFQANVFGAADTTVSWIVSNGVGAITANGLYTAPMTLPAGASFAYVQAKSHADTTAIATAVVNFGKASDSTICFTGAVLPVLANSCGTSGCHDPGKHAAGLDLTSHFGALKAVRPGDARNSRLFQAIVDFNANHRMPPPPAQALTPNEIRIIGQWIDQGAQNTSCE